jgi:hypothetical protein
LEEEAGQIAEILITSFLALIQQWEFWKKKMDIVHKVEKKWKKKVDIITRVSLSEISLW